jgi:hypothetical protein
VIKFCVDKPGQSFVNPAWTGYSDSKFYAEQTSGIDDREEYAGPTNQPSFQNLVESVYHQTEFENRRQVKAEEKILKKTQMERHQEQLTQVRQFDTFSNLAAFEELRHKKNFGLQPKLKSTLNKNFQQTETGIMTIKIDLQAIIKDAKLKAATPKPPKPTSAGFPTPSPQPPLLPKPTPQ